MPTNVPVIVSRSLFALLISWAALPGKAMEAPPVPSWEQIAKDFNAKIPGSTRFTWHDALWLPSLHRHVNKSEIQTGFLQNIQKQAIALDRVRDHFKAPLVVHSWFYPAAYNKLVGGARNSSHLRGTATDFHVEGFTAEQVRKVLQTNRSIYPGAGELGVSWVHLDLEHKAWYHP